MKIIATNGITYLELLDGNSRWYWRSDYAKGDLYEAEELYRDNHPVTCSRLLFVRYPDGNHSGKLAGDAGWADLGFEIDCL